MKAYLLYSELEDYRPKIWRRFYVNKNITLARLCYIVMTLYEMKGWHLLCVGHERPLLTPSGKPGKRMELFGRYAVPNSDADFFAGENEDATKIKLSDVDFGDHSHLVVNYDFGDDWRVLVKLEKELEPAPLSPKDLPIVAAGQGFGILEDCGGIYGLMDLAPVLKTRGDEYKEYCAETGVKDLDLDKFDIEDMNFRLKKLPSIFAKMYEKNSTPSQRSINFINRKYLN